MVSIPSMLLFGMRHALDVDHITAIDNLVSLHNAKKELDGLVLDLVMST
jgi:nickel/cobalt transporter (NiCoT) family protein